MPRGSDNPPSKRFAWPGRCLFQRHPAPIAQTGEVPRRASKQVWFAGALVLLVLAASYVSVQQPQEIAGSDRPANPTRSATLLDPFPQAVNQAMNAAERTQLARSKDDWQVVARQWHAALALIKAVPASSPHHATAQKKIGEYQRNLAYAERLSRDWRKLVTYAGDGRSPGWAEYLDLASLKRFSNETYELQLLNVYGDGLKGYQQVRINCRNGSIQYLSLIQERPNGAKSDLSRSAPALSGVLPTVSQKYCQLFTNQRLQNLPAATPKLF